MSCGSELEGTVASTGHTVGAWYINLEHRTPYRVEAVATLWDLAPSGAVRCRWPDGRVSVSDSARGRDLFLCEACVPKELTGLRAPRHDRHGRG